MDENWNPVDVSLVTSGVPMRVFCDGTGEHMVTGRIVVHHVTTDAAAPVIMKDGKYYYDHYQPTIMGGAGDLVRRVS